MCGRYSFAVEDELIRERFGIRVRTAIYKARYNCAPAQMLAVITAMEPETLNFFKWGLIPSWSRDPSMGARMINARAETLAEKPSFRAAFRHRRCLVPADGFFEWRRDREKSPFRIRMKEGRPFAMAGIWEQWKGEDGLPVNTFSVVTTTPNRLMAEIHDRMPVILRREEEQEWLFGSSPELLNGLLRPYPDEEMEAYAISKRVNSPANDTPDILEPVPGLLL